ncbi:hypothetical protein D3C87_1567490 [compost metagenome]
MAVVNDPAAQGLGVLLAQGRKGGGHVGQTLGGGRGARGLFLVQAVQRDARGDQRRALGGGGALLRPQGGHVHFGARHADVLGQTVGGDDDGDVAGAKRE